MTADWLWTSWSEAGLVAISAVCVLFGVIAIIRIVGLRSLSKMSSFDFAVTVAIGSTVATTAATSTPLANGILTVAVLLGSQAVVAWLRRATKFQTVIDNQPMLLMRDGQFLDDALSDCRITRDDVFAKLREANVLTMQSVRAVVLETTGDVSVLHGDGPLEAILLNNVDRRNDIVAS